MTIDKEFTDLIVELYNRLDELSIYDKQGITISYRQIMKNKNVTPELNYEFICTINASYSSWAEHSYL